MFTRQKIASVSLMGCIMLTCSFALSAGESLPPSIFSLDNLTGQKELWRGNAKILKDEQGEYWSFDKESALIEIPMECLGFDPGNYSKLSLSFRIRPKSEAEAVSIAGRIAEDAFFSITLRPRGQIQLAIYRNKLPASVVLSKDPMPQNVWTSVRFESDGDKVRLFLNEIFQAEAHLPPDKKPLAGDGCLYIGRHPSGLGIGFIGDIGAFGVRVEEMPQIVLKKNEPGRPNFVPGAEPYQYDTNTLFLAHLDGSSLTADGKPLDLVNHNGTWWEHGVFGKALVLSGVCTYVDCGVIPLRGQETISLEGWFYPENDSREMALFSFQLTPISYLGFCLDGNMRPYVKNYLLGKPETVRSQHGIEPGKWHHLLAVFEPGAWTFYVDGRQSISIPGAKTMGDLPADPKLYLGSFTEPTIGFARFFRGAIDEVRVTRGLPSEVRMPPLPTNILSAELLLGGTPPVYQEKNCNVSIQRKSGQSYIVIDNNKIFPAPFVLASLYPAYAHKIVPDFQQAGTRLFMTALLTRPFHSRDWWLGPGEYDFSIIDRFLESTLQRAPDAYLIPTLELSPPSRESGPPQWWEKENPEELYKLSKGEISAYYKAQYSYSSRKWLADASAMLTAAIKHIEAKPYASHIIGYHLTAGPYSENLLWMHRHRDPRNQGDYSRPEVEGFRSWIENKYGTLDNLNKAWNTKFNDWSAVTVPSMERRLATEMGTLREPARMRDVADYILYQNETVARYLLHFAKVAKEACGRRKLVGAYYGYVLENCLGVNWGGHDAFGMLLRSPDMDYFSKPPAYWDRRLGETGGGDMNDAVASIALHGKLRIDENDIRTHLCEDEGSCGALNYADDVAVLRRGFLNALDNGMGLWWMSLSGHAYGDPPEAILMNEIAAIQQIGKAVLEMDAEPQNGSHHDTAIFIDERGGEYFSALEAVEFLKYYPWNIVRTAAKAGLGFDTYLLSDFENVALNSYKLVVFANCFELSSERIAMIKKYLDSEKGMVIDVYASGLYRDGLLAPKDFKDHFGMDVRLRAGKPPAKFRLVSTGEQTETSGSYNHFAVEKGADVKVLANYLDSGEIAVAEKGKVVYCGSADIGVSLLREIAGEAGAHIWTDEKGVLFVAPRFIGLHTASPAKKTVKLPAAAEVVFDVYEQRILARNASDFNVELPARYTGLYYFGPEKYLQLLQLKRPVLKAKDYQNQGPESGWKYSEIRATRVGDNVDEKELLGLLDQRENIMPIADKEHIPYKTKYWKSVEDFSAKVATAWNKKYFYVIVEILDDVYAPASKGENLWKGDNVQIQINRNRGAGGDDLFIFTISPGNPIGCPHAYICAPGRLAGIDPGRIKMNATSVTETDDNYKGYRLCMGIPWDLLELEPGAENWRMDVCPHDTDATGGTKNIGSLSTLPWGGIKPGQRCSPVRILK